MKATELLLLARWDLCVVLSHYRAAGKANRQTVPDDSILESGQDDDGGSNTPLSKVVAEQ